MVIKSTKYGKKKEMNSSGVRDEQKDRIVSRRWNLCKLEEHMPRKGLIRSNGSIKRIIFSDI